MKSHKEISKLRRFFTNDRIVSLLLLTLIVFITYFNVLNADFVSDDITGVRDNPRIGDPGLILVPPFLPPLLKYIAYLLGGVTPFFYHLQNILFHLGAVCLLYLTMSILGTPIVAFFAAALFAAHPLLTESVSWISAVSYPQYSFFLFMSLFCYIASRKRSIYIVSIVLFAFSILSSEKAVVLPVMLVIYEWSMRRISTNWKRVSPYIIVVILLSGLYLANIGPRVKTFESQHAMKVRMYNPLKQIPVASTTYLRLIVWPKTLVMNHSSEDSVTKPDLIIAWTIFLMYLAALYIAALRDRYLCFWMAFFLVALLPVFLPLSIIWFVAERYAYLATAGICTAVAYLAFRLAGNNKQKKMAVCLVLSIAVAALMARAIIRNQDWQSEDSLAIANANGSPQSFQAHVEVGNLYMRRGNYIGAKKEFSILTGLFPTDADMYHNLGNAELMLGELDNAQKNYELAIKYNPNRWQAYQNIASIYYRKQDYPNAIVWIKRAITAAPYNQELKDVLVLYEKKSTE